MQASRCFYSQHHASVHLRGVRTLTRPAVPAQQRVPSRRRVAVAVAAPPRDTESPTPSDAPSTLDKDREELRKLVLASSSSTDMEDNEGDCPVFIDREGNMVEVMCCDYGFRSNSGRMYQQGYGQIPKSAWSLAWDNFKQEWMQLRRSFRYNEYKKISALNPPKGPIGKATYGAGSVLVNAFASIDAWLESRHWFTTLLPTPFPTDVMDEKTGSIKGECKQIRAKLKRLQLSNKAVWNREHAREAAGGGVDTPWIVKGVYYALCIFLDVAYNNRPIQRFWFLETVARMPYFSYITMLHLYESLGWWRAGAELRKVHFAEEWNELHHLQIMESLGGDQLWIDRFMAQHAAIVYYIILVLLFVFSPKLAYNFSELIEAHAVDTYGEFADANEKLLKKLPPPYVAVQYYLSGDYYLFDEFQTSQARTAQPRKPSCNTLYDVFINIRDDEGEHVRTMAACQDMTIMTDLEVRRDSERRL